MASSEEAMERSETREQMIERPMRAPEVELVGRMPDTAFDEDHWLICYGDSHYIQATKLLYHVLLFCDGETPLEEIARRVSEEAGIDLTADQIRWLVENRLSTSGLLVMPAPAESDPAPAAPEPDRPSNGASDGTSTSPVQTTAPAVKQQAPVTKPQKLRLGIRSRVPLLPYKYTAPITGVLQHLYWPPLMIAAAILALGINVWLFRTGEVLASVRTVLFTPELALLIFAIDLGMRLFHEFGHAAALRRAGVGYGTIGFAFLIIWPVFYTDVTHAYRLNRAQRIRVDMGGMYFQLYVIIGLYVAYMLTNQPVLILAILFTGISIIEQFTPLIRFDGYYAAADILGIPEPMSLIVPYVSDHLPWRRNQPKRLPPMRPFARIGYAVYLLLLIGFIIYPVFFVGIAGNALMGYIVESGKLYWHQFVIAWLNHDVVIQIIATLQLFMWLLLPLGFGLLAFRLLQGLGKAARSLTLKALDRWSPRRILATWGMMGALLLAAAGMAVPNAYAWASGVVNRQLEARTASVPPVIQPIVPGSLAEQQPETSAARQPLAEAGVSSMNPSPVESDAPASAPIAQPAPVKAMGGGAAGQGVNRTVGFLSDSSQMASHDGPSSPVGSISNPEPVNYPALSPTPGPSPALSSTPSSSPPPTPAPSTSPSSSASPSSSSSASPTPAPSTSLLSPLPSRSKSPPKEHQSSSPKSSQTPSQATGSAQPSDNHQGSNSGKNGSKNDSSKKGSSKNSQPSSSVLPATEPSRGKSKTSLLAPK